jgi:hypothetical protein
MYLKGAKLRNVLQKYPDIPKQALTWNSKKAKENAESTYPGLPTIAWTPSKGSYSI